MMKLWIASIAVLILFSMSPSQSLRAEEHQSEGSGRPEKGQTTPKSGNTNAASRCLPGRSGGGGSGGGGWDDSSTPRLDSESGPGNLALGTGGVSGGSSGGGGDFSGAEFNTCNSCHGTDRPISSMSAAVEAVRSGKMPPAGTELSPADRDAILAHGG